MLLGVINKNLLRLLKILFIIILFFLLWYGWNYAKPVNFPIKQVRIVSAYEHVDKNFLQNLVASYAKNGFFYLDAANMKRDLLSSPWIYAVSIQRKWPDTLIVNIVEQQALLRWGADGLVNNEGEIFTPPVATFPKNLPLIFGPIDMKFEIFNLYQRARQCFEPLGLVIKELIFDPYKYWIVLLNTNTIIYLKESKPLEQIKFLVSVYKKITQDHGEPPKSIDLRYNTDGIAVKWE
jgi:cell division protein FtsQ